MPLKQLIIQFIRAEYRKILFGVSLFVFFLFLSLVLSRFLSVKKVHSAFENEFIYQGCSVLLEKTSGYGTCKKPSGEEIKIVKLENNTWYLSGETPSIWR